MWEPPAPLPALLQPFALLSALPCAPGAIAGSSRVGQSHRHILTTGKGRAVQVWNGEGKGMMWAETEDAVTKP